MMKKTLLVFGWLFLACKAGQTPVEAPDVLQKPKIACDEPEHDFGVVAQGEEARHVFTIRNVGDAPLKIESARGG